MKLREVYQKLRSEHIVLLRTNGETQKTLQVKDKEKSGMEEEVEVRERVLQVSRCLVLFATLSLFKETRVEGVIAVYGD